MLREGVYQGIKMVVPTFVRCNIKVQISDYRKVSSACVNLGSVFPRVFLECSSLPTARMIDQNYGQTAIKPIPSVPSVMNVEFSRHSERTNDGSCT